MKWYLSIVRGSSLSQEKCFKYSLLHETATNELLQTTANSLMLLIPPAPQHCSRDTPDLPSRTMSSEKASSISQGTKSLWPNHENTSLLNQYALP